MCCLRVPGEVHLLSDHNPRHKLSRPNMKFHVRNRDWHAHMHLYEGTAASSATPALMSKCWVYHHSSASTHPPPPEECLLCVCFLDNEGWWAPGIPLPVYNLLWCVVLLFSHISRYVYIFILLSSDTLFSSKSSLPCDCILSAVSYVAVFQLDNCVRKDNSWLQVL